jgi:hypothetical protein
MHPDDEPPDDGVIYAPAPSPEEVAAACKGPGGWTKAKLAAWGVPYPPPKGWRAELERRYRLGLDVEPLGAGPTAKEAKGPNASMASTRTTGPGTAVPITVRDIGTIDPDDPPPWL